MCVRLWLSSMGVSGSWLPYRTQRLLIPRSATGVQRAALLFSRGCCFKFAFVKCREHVPIAWGVAHATVCMCGFFSLTSRVEGGVLILEKGWSVGHICWRTPWFQHMVVRESGIQGLVASHETISQESRNNSSPLAAEKATVEVVSAIKSACPTIMGTSVQISKIV